MPPEQNNTEIRENDNIQNDTTQFALLKPLVVKYKSLENKIPKIEDDFKIIQKKKFIFLEDIKKEHIYYAMLCVLALIFDFILSRITMKPLTKGTQITPELFALIFNLMDAIIAVLASGILAYDLVGRQKQRKIWLPILWALCAIKIVLFIGFAYKSTAIMGIVFIVALVILVYSILHYAGSGLYFLFGKIKYFVLEQWYDNPTTKNQELIAIKHEIDRECSNNNFDRNTFYQHYNLNV